MEKGKKNTAKDKIAEIVQPTDREVSINLSSAKWEEILFGLFGSKESLRKHYEKDFVVDLDGLLQFHHLLSQKTEQNKFISPKIFRAEMNYENGITRVINSETDLERFVETENVDVKSVNMEWEFLRQKDISDVPQKQKVILYLDTVENKKVAYSEKELEFNKGNIQVKIEHTDQIWAKEVLNHFDNEINKIIYDYNKVYIFFNRVRKLATLPSLIAVGFLFTILGMFYIYLESEDLLTPVTTRSELHFDLATTLVKANKDDTELLLQFFVIRDLNLFSNKGVIDAMNQSNYFRPEFEPIVEKMISSYYNDETVSERLIKSLDARIQGEKARRNIIQVYNFLRFIILFLFITISGLIYVKLFRRKSFIALTKKAKNNFEKDEQKKASYLQVIFGVFTTLIAALIIFLLQLISF